MKDSCRLRLQACRYLRPVGEAIVIEGDRKRLRLALQQSSDSVHLPPRGYNAKKLVDEHKFLVIHWRRLIKELKRAKPARTLGWRSKLAALLHPPKEKDLIRHLCSQARSKFRLGPTIDLKHVG